MPTERNQKDIEQLEQTMKDLQEKMQNEAIDKVYDLVEHLHEKAIRSDYTLTPYEQKKVTLMYSMIKWIYENA